MYCRKVIDWWQTDLYSANVLSPTNNTGTHGFMAIKVNGGDGGNGGNGGNGQDAGSSVHSGGGGGGGVVPVVTEERALIVTSNLTPTTSNPLGTLTSGHTITDLDDSDNKLTYDTFQATTNAGGNTIGMQSTGGTGGSGGNKGNKGGASADDGNNGSAGNDGKMKDLVL